jgi:uncharacterized protein
MRVRLAADGSQAVLVLPPGLTPAQLSTANTSAVAKGAGVAMDATVERMIAAIVAAYKPAGPEQQFVLAKSTPAVAGTNGQVEWAKGFDITAKAQASAANAAVDHHAGQNYIRVKTGDVVGTWKEPTGGSDGRDVKGGVIKSQRGKAVPFTLHKTLTRDSQNRIIAQAEGVLVLLEGTLSVNESLTISGSVDFSTGNIDFSGTVEVLGGVASGFKVKADKDLSIHGLVECAQVECGGNFTAKGGIVGHGKGTLRVKGNAGLVYAEKVHGEIEGHLTVERELVDCTLSIGEGLKCPNGTILGGHIAVTGSLDVKSLGSEADVPTTIVLGSVPILESSRAAHQKAIEQINATLADMAEQERLIKINPKPSARDREKLTEFSYEISQHRTDLAKHAAALAEVEATLKTRQKVDIHIAKIIHPKVTFIAGGVSVLFKVPLKGPLWIGWDEHRHLIFKVAHGPARPLSDVAQVFHVKPAAVKPTSAAA